MATPLSRAIALGCALLLSCVAAAQALHDPTLPPAAMHGVATETVAPPTMKLQMILRGPDDVQRALIDGRWLRAGELLTGTSARVLRITNTAVLLARDNEVETLELVPTITKRAALSDDEREAPR